MFCFIEPRQRRSCLETNSVRDLEHNQTSRPTWRLHLDIFRCVYWIKLTSLTCWCGVLKWGCVCSCVITVVMLFPSITVTVCTMCFCWTCFLLSMLVREVSHCCLVSVGLLRLYSLHPHCDLLCWLYFSPPVGIKLNHIQSSVSVCLMFSCVDYFRSHSTFLSLHKVPEQLNTLQHHINKV